MQLSLFSVLFITLIAVSVEATRIRRRQQHTMEMIKFYVAQRIDPIDNTAENGSTNLMLTSFDEYTQYGVPANCFPHEKFTIIVHGWKESCAQPWIVDLVRNLDTYRGGCIMCMDYSALGNRYTNIWSRFPGIHTVLTNKLLQLEAAGMDMADGFLYGFSFGARVVIEAAGNLGYRKIGRIDACDPARPGFDRRRLVDPQIAAKIVQCIHTSDDKGTLQRNCHLDWLMGDCGVHQDAASSPPYGSHGLCPYFYNSAFTHDFMAVPKPNGCLSYRTANYWPTGFKMGYMENRTGEVYGDVFALTSEIYPFNVILKSDEN